MALRTLGATTLAKSNPGSKTRDVEEMRSGRPAIPGKGQAGTIARSLIEEPLNRAVPAGSNKVVSVQPTVEGNTVLPRSVVPPSAAVRPGADGQALFQGGVNPSQGSPVRPTGQAATGISGGSILGAGSASGRSTVGGPAKAINAPVAPKALAQVSPLNGSILGGKQIVSPNFVQGPIQAQVQGARADGVPYPTPTPFQSNPSMQQKLMQSQGITPGTLRSGSSGPVDVGRILAGGAGQAVEKIAGLLRSLFGR